MRTHGGESILSCSTKPSGPSARTEALHKPSRDRQQWESRAATATVPIPDPSSSHLAFTSSSHCSRPGTESLPPCDLHMWTCKRGCQGCRGGAARSAQRRGLQRLLPPPWHTQQLVPHFQALPPACVVLLVLVVPTSIQRKGKTELQAASCFLAWCGCATFLPSPLKAQHVADK